MMSQTNLGNAMTIINNTARRLVLNAMKPNKQSHIFSRLVQSKAKPNKPFQKHQISSILLVMVMCWASQSSAQPTRANAKFYSTMGICHVAEKVTSTEDKQRYDDELKVEFTAWEAIALHNPYYVQNGRLSDNEYARQKIKETSAFNFYDIDPGTAIVKVLQQPKHGKLIINQKESFIDTNGYSYKPELNYIGNDKAVFLVNLANRNIKVIYYFKVPSEALPDTYNFQDTEKYLRKYCPSLMQNQ